jgi:hypothetical protein
VTLDLRDWAALRWPAIFFGVSVIVAGAMVWYAGQKTSVALRALELQNGNLNQAQQAYLTVAGEREAIAKYLLLYRQLVQQGLVGEERRTEWIEELRDITHQHNLLGVNYQISPQQAVKTPTGTNTNIILAHRSVMRLELALLHEVDFLTMLNALRDSRHAVFRMRSCEIKPIAGVEKSHLIPQLTANCEIDWLTITEPRKSGVKP